MFAERVFGGRMRGNWYHQFVEIEDKILDLTDYDPEADPLAGEGLLYGFEISGFKHDPKFWRSRAHRESMASCDPRVRQWADELGTQRSCQHEVKHWKTPPPSDCACVVKAIAGEARPV